MVKCCEFYFVCSCYHLLSHAIHSCIKIQLYIIITIEVGTLGHFNNQTIASLHASPIFGRTQSVASSAAWEKLQYTAQHTFSMQGSAPRGSHPHSLALFPLLTDHPQAPIPPLNPIFFYFFKTMYKYMYTYYCIVPPHPLHPPCKLPPSRFTQNTSYACQ